MSSAFHISFHFSSTYSRFIVYFKDDSIVPLIRSEYHTLIDFLANSGGLIGLFMGASMLSFIELIYYLTLRMVRALVFRRDGKIHGNSN